MAEAQRRVPAFARRLVVGASVRCCVVRRGEGHVWGRAVLGRKRSVVSGTALSFASAAVVFLAFTAHGFPTKNLSLNDGGVWVTSDQTGADPSSPHGAFARLNKQIDAFDASFAPPGLAQTSYNVDVFQNGTTVLARDLAAGKLYRVNVAVQVADPSQSLQVPDDDAVALGGSTVAVVEPSTGKTWIRGADGLGNFSLQAKPDATAGGGAALAVSADGIVFVASAAKHQLLTISASHTAKSTPLPADLANLAVAAVGSTPVVLDQKSGAVFIPGHKTATLPKSASGGFVVQQSGPSAGSVLVADGKGLYSVSLKSSDVATVSGVGTGTPAQPVRLGGCVYAAWAGGQGTLVRACNGKPSVYPLTAMGSIGSQGVVFRVNRNVIVLNDPVTGATTDITKAPTRVDNWDDVKPAVENANHGQQTQGKQTSSTSSDHALKALADKFGARPGRVTVLHVLDNDSAPDNDILAVASITTPDDESVKATVTPDGQAIAIDVPASDTSGDVHFMYVASDEKGRTSTAPVTVSIRSKDQNEPPALRPGYHAKQWQVGRSGVFSYPVLTDWRDYDGDPLVLKSVTVGAGSVSASADGRITYTAPATAGPQRITYEVWDGVGDPVTGTFDIDVLGADAAAVPATTEPDIARAFVGQQITILPLANDVAGADPSNPQAQLTLSGTIPSPAGATVTADQSTGTVTFTARQQGTFDLVYHAAFGSAKTSEGHIRVDVVQQPGANTGPVAMPDVAVLRGQQATMVDVLANDTDPAGGVLTVESAAPVDPRAGLQAEVVNGRWLRLMATTANIGGPQVVHYQVTNGTSPAVTGDVTVTQLPTPTGDVLPVAEDDMAVVRAGDVVAVDVLANDTDPNGGSLTLVQGGLTARPQLGGAYASGRLVRYAAPASVQNATSVVVDYVVQNAAGESATGHLDITVNPIDAAHDSPPHPPAVEARAIAGGSVVVQVPTYNIDPDGDSVTLVGMEKAPTLGQISSLNRDSFVYRAYPTSAGTDVFEYQVQDRFGQLGVAQVRVGIVPAGVPQAPVAIDDVVTAAPGANVHVDVLANDFVAPDDHVTIEPLATTNNVVPVGVSLDRTLVRVKAPAAGAAPVVLLYGITDGTGAVSVAQITVRSKAGFDNPPIARDDTVDELPSSGTTVTVPVTDNDDDPDGDQANLVVTKVFDPTAVIQGKNVVVTIQSYAQTIGYQISDPQGQVAMAVIYVPGRAGAASPPKLKADIQPVEVAQGGQKTISISDYVVDPRGRSVRLTTSDKISGSPADSLQATSQGDTTLMLHSIGSYSGAAAVTFEVTDGSNLSDPSGLKAVLTIPVKIGAPPPTLKCPTTPLQVTAGGAPVSVDVTALCQVISADPTQISLLKFTSALTSLGGVKLTSSGAHGEKLQLVAGAEAKPDSTGTINVGIAGTPSRASIAVVVKAAPLATVKAISVGGVKAGQTATVDIASYVQSPFGAKAQVAVLAVKQTSTGSNASATSAGSKVSITPAADAHGTFTFDVTVTDLVTQPERAVHGTITMEVLGVPGKPGTPTLNSVSSHTVVLGFSASASNGSPVDQYQISDSGGKTYPCAAAPCTVSGLTNGHPYTFTVRAHNAVGWGPPSDPSTQATPNQVPDPVSGLTAKPGDTSVSLQWSPAHVDGTAVTSYEVQISPDPGSGPIQKTSGTSLTWSGLQNGTQYSFQVRADNAAGAGQFGAAAQAVPFGKPKTMAAPTAAAAQSADLHEQAVTVSWAPADGNGRDITGYTLTVYRNGSASGTSSAGATATSATFTIANDGSKYQYSIVATNAAQLTSDPSPQSTPPITAAAAPDPITSVSASDHDSSGGYDTKIHVSFTLPQSNGSPLTSVNYSLSGGPSGSWSNPGSPGTNVTEVISGLTNGKQYTVTVTACNAKGCGAPSPASNAVTPYGVPLPPTGVKATVSGQTITVSWSAPASNGRGISGYKITWSGGGAVTTSSTSYAFKSLAWNTNYTFTVYTVDSLNEASSGVNTSAKTPAQPGPSPSISVSPGAQYVGPGCSANCYWVFFTMSNFQPNTSYTFSCLDNGAVWWSHSITTDGNGAASMGTNGCWNGYAGHTISITAGGIVGSYSPWP